MDHRSTPRPCPETSPAGVSVIDREARFFRCVRCDLEVCICAACDHGQVACPATAAPSGGASRCGIAGAKYQRGPKGARKHAARQRKYAAKFSSQILTHHSIPHRRAEHHGDRVVGARSRARRPGGSAMALWPTTLRIGGKELKLLVTSPEGDDLLKARLPIRPPHPRALLTLLEGVALWSGEPRARCDFCRGAPRRLARLRRVGRRPVAHRKPARPLRLRDPTLPRRAARSSASVTSATCAAASPGLVAMKLVDPSGHVAEVLRLGLVEGVSVRADRHAGSTWRARPCARSSVGTSAPAEAGDGAARLAPRSVRDRDPHAARRHARDARAGRARAAASARLHRRRHDPARPAAAACARTVSARRS